MVEETAKQSPLTLHALWGHRGVMAEVCLVYWEEKGRALPWPGDLSNGDSEERRNKNSWTQENWGGVVWAL